MRFITQSSLQAELESIPFTTWTPTVSAASGSIGSLTSTDCRYRVWGRILWYNVNVKINSNGSAAGDIRISTPSGYDAITKTICSGRESDVTGHFLQCLATPGLLILWRADNSYPGGSSYRMLASGFYRIA